MLFTNKKKKYFLHKADGVQKMIWDLEFKREKTLMIREEVRREFDGTKAKAELINTKIRSQLKHPDKMCEVHNPEKGKEKVPKGKAPCRCEYIDNHMPIDEIERLYDSRELMLRDGERYILQMKQMDIDVHGSPKTNELPDGADGIDQQLESLHELKIMIGQYLKKI